MLNPQTHPIALHPTPPLCTPLLCTPHRPTDVMCCAVLCPQASVSISDWLSSECAGEGLFPPALLATAVQVRGLYQG